MSKIGKRLISVPQGVQIEIKGNILNVKGPKGELMVPIHPLVSVAQQDQSLVVKTNNNTKLARSLWGTTKVMIDNQIQGVTEGFSKKMEIHGVGYRAAVTDKNLILNVGFSHPVEITPPPGIEITVAKNEISVLGIDKQLVGQVAANIRRVKPPEPYKGKGIKYVGETLRRKAGKAAKAAGASA